MRQLLFVALFVSGPVVAQETERDDFIRDNLIAVFYHEFGHALIDRLSLPIYGQEEDAADVASVMLMDRLYENERATEMVIATANSFNGEVILSGDEEPAYWGVHGIDEQRYYNTICVFYGGDPEAREDMITLMGLPEERAEGCADEFDQANHSWGLVLDEISEDVGTNTFQLDVRDDSAVFTSDIMAAELDALNRDFALSIPLVVIVDACGEPNAFYNLEESSITMCSEFAAHLGAVFDALEE